MAKKELRKIFLSASVPSPDRNKKYYHTADIIAIRDAIIAFATVVIPKAHLVWGGHPAITPLIKEVMGSMDYDVHKHITLYQSLFFEDKFPKDNDSFGNIKLIPKKSNIPESVKIMREQMFSDNQFDVAVFIGGMEGIEDEYSLFIKRFPDALIVPVASTGAASKILYDRLVEEGKISKSISLENDYAYMALFSDLLKNYIL